MPAMSVLVRPEFQYGPINCCSSRCCSVGDAGRTLDDGGTGSCERHTGGAMPCDVCLLGTATMASTTSGGGYGGAQPDRCMMSSTRLRAVKRRASDPLLIHPGYSGGATTTTASPSSLSSDSGCEESYGCSPGSSYGHEEDGCVSSSASDTEQTRTAYQVAVTIAADSEPVALPSASGDCLATCPGTSTEASIFLLPYDAQFEICKHLAPEDLARLARTCTHFCDLCRSEALWKHLCKRDFRLTTRGRCQSYAKLYVMFHKVYQLVESGNGDHLYKETDMLWFMASCSTSCPVDRWRTVSASKVRQFGLSLEKMARLSPDKMVATGQIGHGGRMVHHYSWAAIVKTLAEVHGSQLGVQRYLIRRCLDHRITSSVHERHERLRVDRREARLMRALAARPAMLETLLTGLYRGTVLDGGRRRRKQPSRRSDDGCSAEGGSQMQLRDEAVFLVHPLLRQYRRGRVRGGLDAVLEYVRCCDAVLRGVRSGRWCRRDGMETHDYSACLCFVHKRLEQRLESGGEGGEGATTGLFDDMMSVAELYYSRLARVWQWQSKCGTVHMWRHRPACVVTGHSACGDFLASGNTDDLRKLIQYFEERENFCRRLDNLVHMMDDCIPRDEIEVLYLSMAVMPPRKGFSTGALFACPHHHHQHHHAYGCSGGAMPASHSFGYFYQGTVGCGGYSPYSSPHPAGYGSCVGGRNGGAGPGLVDLLHSVPSVPCRHPSWVEPPTELATFPMLLLHQAYGGAGNGTATTSPPLSSPGWQHHSGGGGGGGSSSTAHHHHYPMPAHMHHLHAPDGVMFQRTVLGWEYQQRLRQWLRTTAASGSPDSATATTAAFGQRKQVYVDAYNLVGRLLATGSAESRDRVNRFLLERYQHHSDKLQNKRTVVANMLRSGLMERPPLRTAGGGRGVPQCPKVVMQSIGLATRTQPPFVPSTGSGGGGNAERRSTLTMLRTRAAVLSGRVLHHNSPSVGDARSNEEAMDPSSQVQPGTTPTPLLQCRKDPAAACDPCQESWSGHESPSDVDVCEATKLPLASDSGARGKPAQPECSPLLSKHPSHNRGLIGNNMIVTAYSHIDRNAYQYFYLYKDPLL